MIRFFSYPQILTIHGSWNQQKYANPLIVSRYQIFINFLDSKFSFSQKTS